MFSCNLPPAVLAKWQGSFTCYCGNTADGTDTKIQISKNIDPGEENYPTAWHFNQVAICGPHFSFFFFFFWGDLTERDLTVFILSSLLGQPGVTHAPFYAMNGECDRVDVTIAFYIYIYKERERVCCPPVLQYLHFPVIWLKLLSRCTCVYTQEYIYIDIDICQRQHNLFSCLRCWPSNLWLPWTCMTYIFIYACTPLTVWSCGKFTRKYLYVSMICLHVYSVFTYSVIYVHVYKTAVCLYLYVLPGRWVRVGRQVRVGRSGQVGHGNLVCQGWKAGQGRWVGQGRQVRVGRWVRVGRSVRIGRWVRVGRQVRVGRWVRVGRSVWVGRSVRVGRWVRVGRSVRVGRWVRVGKSG